MIPLEDAQVAADVLRDAAAACPVRILASSLRARADEWRRACVRYEAALEDDDKARPEIVPAAAVMIGSRLFVGEGPVEVIRVVNGGTGIQVHQLGGGTWYENPLEGCSPVVAL